MITLQDRIELAAVVVLRHLAALDGGMSALLEGDDRALEPLFDWLARKGFVEIDDDARYRVAEAGAKSLDRFSSRYREFVSNFDVYGAVDLEAGEFAFERYFEFDHEEDFQAYLELERFSDLRLTVARFKGLPTLEVVFMGAVHDDTFVEPGWQERLLADETWSEFEAIDESAVRMEELADPEDASDDGSRVLLRIIEEGAMLNLALRKHEDELAAERADDEAQDDETYTVEEYQAYVDPYFVAPVWGGLWFL